ncbi:MAG: hypothetical protein KDE47_21990, partial [Caldilineaceae bacterium]|nr:hypothetical protein [Caldilineaceae bacterium]
MNLSWLGGDPNVSDDVVYDIFLDTQTPPATIVSAGQPETSYTVPSMLGANAIYYWQVVANDGVNAPVFGPIWSFSTAQADCQDANMSLQPVVFVTGWSGSVGNNHILQDDQLRYFEEYLSGLGYRSNCNLFYVTNTDPHEFMDHNAVVIRNQVCSFYDDVKQINTTWDGSFDIIAHSYGGLRARWYLETNGLYGSPCPAGFGLATSQIPRVRNLFTMGSPHGGEPYLGRLQPLAAYIGYEALKDQQLAAAFEMLPPVRLVDNLRHSQPSDVCYRVYAGDANAQFPLLSIAIQLAFLNSSISPPFLYPNDLAVNQTSAELVNHYNPLVSAILPILYPHVSIHHTVDIHGYHPRLGDAVRTFVFPDTFFEEELRNNLGSSSCPAREGVTTPAGLPDPENVPVPSLETLFARSEPTGISSSVNITATTLQNGQIVSGQFDIESAGVHRVQLAWPEGAVDFALTTPYGQEVSRYTADGDPNATYLHLDTGFGLLTTYVVTTTVGGAWSYEITVNDVPTDTLVTATLYPATPIGLNVSQP